MPKLWFKTALLPGGWAEDVRLGILDGGITSVETGVYPETGDEGGMVALPGLCNVHSHAFQRGMAGLTERRGSERDDFWSWRELMYRFLDRMTPEDVESIAALAYAEMLEAGFTRVGEFHYLHHDVDGRPYADVGEMAARIVVAAEQTGIGLTLLPVLYAHSNFGGTEPSPGQRRFVNDQNGFENLFERSREVLRCLPDAVLGVAPHSLRAVTPEELAGAVALAPTGPIHIHAAEQTREVEDCLAWSGKRPVEWLLDNTAVDSRWQLVHATHVTPEETARLAASGAVAGLCPITEANLGDGVFPADDYLAAGGAFGVGTDSNVQIDAAQELRLMEYAQRLTRRARNVLAPSDGRSTGRALFEGALAGGSRALGQTTWGLREGASADIVELASLDSAFAARVGDALIDTWIFGGRPGLVFNVWRAGRKVVVAGRHLAYAEIRGRFRTTLRRLLES